jgi:hypothetical protein
MPPGLAARAGYAPNDAAKDQRVVPAFVPCRSVCSGSAARQSARVRSHPHRSEQRPDIGAVFPASLANEQRLQIGQPDVIGPAIRADRDRIAATIIRAIN